MGNITLNANNKILYSSDKNSEGSPDVLDQTNGWTDG